MTNLRLEPFNYFTDLFFQRHEYKNIKCITEFLLVDPGRVTGDYTVLLQSTHPVKTRRRRQAHAFGECPIADTPFPGKNAQYALVYSVQCQ